MGFGMYSSLGSKFLCGNWSYDASNDFSMRRLFPRSVSTLLMVYTLRVLIWFKMSVVGIERQFFLLSLCILIQFAIFHGLAGMWCLDIFYLSGCVLMSILGAWLTSCEGCGGDIGYKIMGGGFPSVLFLSQIGLMGLGKISHEWRAYLCTSPPFH